MGILFRVFGKGSKAIGSYLGLVDSLEIKIKKLIQSELNSGIMALRQAQNSDAETESLLREARSRFNKAIYLEKEERLVAAYLGLALCHYQLKDINNAANTLKEFSQTKIEINWQKKVTSSLRGECGYLLTEAAENFKKILGNSRFKKKLISNHKLFTHTNNYLHTVLETGQKLSDENYYRTHRLISEIEQLKVDSEILANHLTQLTTYQISPHQLERLTQIIFLSS